MKAVISIRVEKKLLKSIQKMAEENAIPMPNMVRELLKIGFNYLASTRALPISLSESQENKLSAFNGDCTYQILLILQEYLLKNDPIQVEKMGSKSRNKIRNLLGLDHKS